jgi:hypothetical protein
MGRSWSASTGGVAIAEVDRGEREQVVERDGDDEHERAEQIAGKDVAGPVLAFAHARDADEKEEIEADGANQPEERTPARVDAVAQNGEVEEEAVTLSMAKARGFSSPAIRRTSYLPGVRWNYWGPRFPDTWRPPSGLRMFYPTAAYPSEHREHAIGYAGALAQRPPHLGSAPRRTDVL